MNGFPNSPLDAEERALADALKRLPSPVPSSELDARILAQARQANRHAARSTVHRRLRWWTAGMSSVAVAVLAVGIAWQVGPWRASQPALPEASPSPVHPSITPNATVDNAAGATPASQMPAADEATAPARGRQSPIESRTDEAEQATAPVVRAFPGTTDQPAPSPATRQESGRDQAARRVQPVSEPIAAPVPPPPAAPAPAAAPAPPAPSIVQERAPASISTPPPQAAAASSMDDARNTLQLKSTAQTVDVSDWHADTALAPEAWLSRIHMRWVSGDREAARASLRAFRHAHPDHAIPDELAELSDR